MIPSNMPFSWQILIRSESIATSHTIFDAVLSEIVGRQSTLDITQVVRRNARSWRPGASRPQGKTERFNWMMLGVGVLSANDRLADEDLRGMPRQVLPVLVS